MTIPAIDKHFQSVINRKNRIINETKEEKIKRIKLERGLTHGTGKRNKKKKRGKK